MLDRKTDYLALAAELTAAWLSNPNTRASADEVPGFLRSTFDAIKGLETASEPLPEQALEQEHTPAVSVRKSLASPDHIISMLDGKPYKTLRRHLATNGLTPEQYRERYKLKPDYPMVAANYSESRRAMAKQIGLGRKPATQAATDAAAPDETAKPKRARRSGTEAPKTSRERLRSDKG